MTTYTTDLTTDIVHINNSHLTFLMKDKVLRLNLDSLKAKLSLKEILPSKLSLLSLLKHSR